MKTIGMIAGNGRFPLLVAKKARQEGYRVVIGGIEKEVDNRLAPMADVYSRIKVGELKKLVKFFRSEGVHEAVMAGKVEKVRLFQENVRPDFDMLRVLMKTRDFKDDSLLTGIADYLHAEGVDLLDSTFLLKDAMPAEGVLGRKRPTREQMEDLLFGFGMAKSIAGLDIGQTVVVKKKAVLAVEAIEGTDEAIRRGGVLGAGKVTVVKVAKPDQDMRFDVPAVGLKTMKQLINQEAVAFGFEASKTLWMDMEDMVTQANHHGIALVGIQDSETHEKKEK